MPNEVVDVSEDKKTAIRGELDRVLTSNYFKNKNRLHTFLQYIVEETLAGRGGSIRGKNIAKDAFDRELGEGDVENLVRANARRVRRNLDEYYRADGAENPVRIVLETGNYVPAFKFGDEITSHPPPKDELSIVWDWRQVSVGLACGLAIAVAAMAWYGGLTADQRPDGDEERRLAQRNAIFSKSPTSLQAVNLAAQGRGLIFPVFDKERQELTSQLFLRVIDLDPKYFGGYAGAAQSLASMAMLLPIGDERELALEKSRVLSQQALEIAPAEAWTQSAVGWTAMAEGDYNRALEASRRAYEINAKEGNVLDFYAGVALFAGEYEEAAKVSQPGQTQRSVRQRFAHRNIFGAANFHLGNYQMTLQSFKEAAGYGDPVSIASLAYQAAALHALDRKAEGRAIVKTMMQNWPNANIAAVFSAYYKDPDQAADVIDRIVELGWAIP
ncbi:MAG: tetratricopeptide repeat protein [Hyphomicrobiales bacterium]